MKFLTMHQSREWLAAFGATINDDRALLLNSKQHGMRALETHLPSVPPMLANFLERVVDWLPRGKERLLWLSDWTTYPPHSYRFFESVWTAFGGSGPVIETAGCLFKPDHGDVNQEFSEEPESFTLIGLSLLVVNFDWRACIVTQDGDGASRIDFGDECMSFSTSESIKLEEARALLDQFNLKYKQIK
jgi:hypothetical protein